MTLRQSWALRAVLLCTIVFGGCSSGLPEASVPSPSAPQVAAVVTHTPATAREATISGLVFRDFDADGTRDARDQGEPGVTVSAYDDAGRLVAQALTDIDGVYALRAAADADAIESGRQYRIVFAGWPEHLAPGPHGVDSGTEIQFVLGGAEDVNCGLFSPDQYVPESASAASGETPTAAVDATDAPSPSEAEVTPTAALDGSMAAPAFPDGLEWLNVSRPLTWSDLRGKTVLLEFWTYGCIDCIQMVPIVSRLEDKFGDALIVIGVHTAKFPHEAATESIRKIIGRYDLRHPVVNDAGFDIADQYGANVWPTYLIVNPDGKYLGGRAGTMTFEMLDLALARVVDEFEGRGKVDRTPLAFVLGRESPVDSPLRFPNAVLADETSDRLYIVDSGHNRIVVTDLTGSVVDIIGSGRPGREDGDYATASFHHPQGVALHEDGSLYVADTYNHVIRHVDLEQRMVETVAGTGDHGYTPPGGGPARDLPLNWPWDLTSVQGQLYIAMAGQHQIWRLDPEKGMLERFAGGRGLQLTDGPRLSAGLSQPTALTHDGATLYFADSEASAIRYVDLEGPGVVVTVVGMGFWEFGDVDGFGNAVRLQRPSGIAYRDGSIYVADTYNNRIKRIDPVTRESRTFLGTGEPGWADGPRAQFYEPSGLSATRDRLYIADTNNHVVRVAQLSAGSVSTLSLSDPLGLLARWSPGIDAVQSVLLPNQTVGAGTGTIQLDLLLPSGYVVNDLAASLFTWRSDGPAVQIGGRDAERTILGPSFPLSFDAQFSQGEAELTGEATLYYCRAGQEGLCLIERARFVALVTVTTTDQKRVISFSHTVAEP